VLDGRRTAPARVRRVKVGDNPWFEVVLIEGRQNQIRRMFRNLGFLVEKLKRVRIGPLEIGHLKPGEFRPLTERELRKLRPRERKPEITPRPSQSAGPRGKKEDKSSGKGRLSR